MAAQLKKKSSKQSTVETKLSEIVELLNLVIARSVVEVAEDGNNTIRAAAFLGNSPSTLAVWRTKNPPYGPKFSYQGTTPVYSRKDLEEWQEQQRANGKKREVSPRVGRPPGKSLRGRKAVPR